MTVVGLVFVECATIESTLDSARENGDDLKVEKPLKYIGSFGMCCCHMGRHTAMTVQGCSYMYI